jgi:hypothetical protein
MRKLPESDDLVLCWIVDNPITQDGYDNHFLSAFHDLIEKMLWQFIR